MEHRRFIRSIISGFKLFSEIIIIYIYSYGEIIQKFALDEYVQDYIIFDIRFIIFVFPFFLSLCLSVCVFDCAVFAWITNKIRVSNSNLKFIARFAHTFRKLMNIDLLQYYNLFFSAIEFGNFLETKKNSHWLASWNRIEWKFSHRTKKKHQTNTSTSACGSCHFIYTEMEANLVCFFLHLSIEMVTLQHNTTFITFLGNKQTSCMTFSYFVNFIL